MELTKTQFGVLPAKGAFLRHDFRHLVGTLLPRSVIINQPIETFGRHRDDDLPKDLLLLLGPQLSTHCGRRAKGRTQANREAARTSTGSKCKPGKNPRAAEPKGASGEGKQATEGKEAAANVRQQMCDSKKICCDAKLVGLAKEGRSEYEEVG